VGIVVPSFVLYLTSLFSVPSPWFPGMLFLTLALVFISALPHNEHLDDFVTEKHLKL
jgi:hypothetical protein